MADGDRPAIGIETVVGDLEASELQMQLPQYAEGLGGEGLMDLPHIDVRWFGGGSHHPGQRLDALATESHGENSVLSSTGEPAEHKAVLLDPSLLARSKRGLRPEREPQAIPHSSDAGSIPTPPPALLA
jgi:hypothetical protein